MNSLKNRIALNFVVGAGFLATVLVVQALLGAVVSFELVNSIRDLTGAFNNPTLFGTAIISFAISGSLIIFWAHARRWIGKPLSVNVQAPQKLQTQHKVALIFTIIGVGIITSIIFYGFNEAVAGISPNANINDLGTLMTAISEGNFLVVIGAVIAILIFGILVAFVGRLIAPTQKLADTVSFHH